MYVQYACYGKCTVMDTSNFIILHFKHSGNKGILCSGKCAVTPAHVLATHLDIYNKSQTMTFSAQSSFSHWPSPLHVGFPRLQAF